MQLTFRIANLERTLPSGVVFNIHYTVDAVDGEYTVGAYGSIPVAGDPNANGFIAFDDLTEETVIQWVIDQLGEKRITEIESTLAQQIDLKKNPKSAQGLPWDSSSLSN